MHTCWANGTLRQAILIAQWWGLLRDHPNSVGRWSNQKNKSDQSVSISSIEFRLETTFIYLFVKWSCAFAMVPLMFFDRNLATQLSILFNDLTETYTPVVKRLTQIWLPLDETFDWVTWENWLVFWETHLTQSWLPLNELRKNRSNSDSQGFCLVAMKLARTRNKWRSLGKPDIIDQNKLDTRFYF